MIAKQAFEHGLYRTMADYFPLALNLLREEVELEKVAFEAFTENVTIALPELEKLGKKYYDYHDQILVSLIVDTN